MVGIELCQSGCNHNVFQFVEGEETRTPSFSDLLHIPHYFV